MAQYPAFILEYFFAVPIKAIPPVICSLLKTTAYDLQLILFTIIFLLLSRALTAGQQLFLLLVFALTYLFGDCIRCLQNITATIDKLKCTF